MQPAAQYALRSGPPAVEPLADAAGPGRNELQWQKFEDTSTGYFVAHAPDWRPAAAWMVERYP